MFLACRLKITFTSNLKLIISFLVLLILLLSFNSRYHLLAQLGTLHLTLHVYLRLANRPSATWHWSWSSWTHPFCWKSFQWEQWGCQQGWNGSEGHEGIGCIKIPDWWFQWWKWYLLICPNQLIQEIVELENLVGSSCDIGPLGKRSRVGGAGCDAHARGNQRVNNEWWVLDIKQLTLPKFGLKRKFAPRWRTCHAADISQMWQENDAPHRRTCHPADFGQMWQKNDAPYWRTLSNSWLWPNVVQ